MLIVEYYKTRNDGVILNRTYSDANYYIERDGVRYAEAVDPVDLNRIYTETTVLIKEEPESEEMFSEEYVEDSSDF